MIFAVFAVSFLYSRALQTSFALHHSLPLTHMTCNLTALNVNRTREDIFIVTLLGSNKGFIGFFRREAPFLKAFTTLLHISEVGSYLPV